MRGFRYGLEPLLKQRRWEQELAAAQERGARQALERRVADARRAEQELRGAEGRLREARRAGAPIDARSHEATSLYLVRLREALRTSANEAARAGEAHERTRQGLLRSLQAVRALEKHRDNRRREHERERRTLAEQRQDELWLTGRRSSWR